jgi:putative peptidoglycan lipid II flippase
MVMNLALIGPFAHVGLAAATSLSAFINAGLLYWYLTKQGVFTPLAGWSKLFGQVLVANVVLVAAIMLINPDVQDWLDFTGWERLAWLLGMVLSVILLYFVTLIGVGLNPKKMLKTPSNPS